MTEIDRVTGFAVALGIGLLIGVDRERRKGTGPAREAAGIRTFAIASLTGAAAQDVGGTTLLAVAIAGVFLLAAVTYSQQRGGDPGITTELSLVLSTVLGAQAMRDPTLAAGLGVAVVILLAARRRLHFFVGNVLSEGEIRSGLILAAASLIVLPILPDQPVRALGALNPHAIWRVVVLSMVIGAAGHVAVRLLGSRAGLPLAGLASGFVSSAATVAAMGSLARERPELVAPASAGAVLSSVATIAQLAIIIGATNQDVLRGLAVPLISAGVVAVVYAAVFSTGLGRSASLDQPQAETEDEDVFDPLSGVKLAAVFAAVGLVCTAMEAHFGAGGVLLAAAAAGFADTHAPAASVAQLASSSRITTDGAVVPVLVAMTTNTATKVFLAVTADSLDFRRRVVPGLVLMVVAAWLGALANLLTT